MSKAPRKAVMPQDIVELWALVLLSFGISILIYLFLAFVGWLAGVDPYPYRFWIHGVGTLLGSYWLQYQRWR